MFRSGTATALNLHETLRYSHINRIVLVMFVRPSQTVPTDEAITLDKRVADD
jgi:hypothetical protein